jgi:hypothetical protein
MLLCTGEKMSWEEIYSDWSRAASPIQKRGDIRQSLFLDREFGRRSREVLVEKSRLPGERRVGTNNRLGCSISDRPIVKRTRVFSQNTVLELLLNRVMANSDPRTGKEASIALASFPSVSYHY